jgi:hypothetical protein
MSIDKKEQTEPCCEFDFEPLKDGNVLMTFYSEGGLFGGGHIINTQVLTPNTLPLIAQTADMMAYLLEHGQEAAKKHFGIK